MQDLYLKQGKLQPSELASSRMASVCVCPLYRNRCCCHILGNSKKRAQQSWCSGEDQEGCFVSRLSPPPWKLQVATTDPPPSSGCVWKPALSTDSPSPGVGGCGSWLGQSQNAHLTGMQQCHIESDHFILNNHFTAKKILLSLPYEGVAGGRQVNRGGCQSW